MSPVRARASLRIAIAAVVVGAGVAGVLSAAPASAAPAGIDTALSSFSFGTVAPGTTVAGPIIFVTSGIAGATLSTSASDPPFVKVSDTCNGVTTSVKTDICSFEFDFDNQTTALSRGRYRSVFTISDAFTGRTLARVRYTASVD
jgi:hypothetical protein